MNVLRQFHNIVSDQALNFSDKVNALLSFGNTLFDLPIGIISEIQNNVYTVSYATSPDNSIVVGTSFDISDTYCCHTLKASKATGFHFAGQSHIATHPCYEKFQLEAYIGAPIYAETSVIGTVNFSGSAPRPPFTQDEIDYIELLAQWVGAELARTSALQRLKRNNNTLKKLESVGKIGTWEVNLKTEVITWSDETYRIHEAAPDYVPVMDTAIAFYPEGENRDRIVAAVENAIATGSGWDLTAQLVTVKGKTIWVSTKGEAEFEHNECVRLFGTFQDITESVQLNEDLRQQKELAELALKERSELIAKISHELRTPLNGIIGMLATFESEKDAARQTEKVKIAQRSANTLMHLINEVLDYSKITQSELKLEPQDFRLQSVFNDAVSIYAPLCEQKKVPLYSCVDIDDSTWVYADATRITQILTNLLGNAIKFTESGAIHIIAEAAQSTSDIKLVFQVKDSGIGMTQDTQKELFQPFRQGAKHITQKYGGTGLGLSITKELTELMGGNINVVSEQGVGSTFTVELTIPVGKQAVANATLQSLPDAQNLNILVVDDNDINRIVMRELLKQFNATADEAVDGLDAIAKCKQSHYDIIFMDCVMPEMDGIRATQLMFEQQIISHTNIVVALTANTSSEDRDKCHAVGMKHFIAKPVQLDAIASVLRERAMTAS